MANGTVTNPSGMQEIDLSSYVGNGWTISGTGYIKAYKYSGMCTIIAKGIVAPSTSAKFTITALPTDVRVKGNLTIHNNATNTSDGTNNYIVQIENSALVIAKIGFADWYTPSKTYEFEVTYPCA